MEPTKDEDAFVDLVDVILREGVVVEADVLITVADVPLVGISLRAAVAGMTTMHEYGHFLEWDAEHRHVAAEDDHRRIESGETGSRASGGDRPRVEEGGDRDELAGSEASGESGSDE